MPICRMRLSLSVYSTARFLLNMLDESAVIFRLREVYPSNLQNNPRYVR